MAVAALLLLRSCHVFAAIGTEQQRCVLNVRTRPSLRQWASVRLNRASGFSLTLYNVAVILFTGFASPLLVLAGHTPVSASSL
ncbi:hypothetical protein, partial [Microvirga massiliensis]|uniref:hypothetical protein n=1 Tax=Microvirga massiliensis TaxID=1033741 RepID=UPI00062B44A8